MESVGVKDSLSNFLDPGKVVLCEISYPTIPITMKKRMETPRNIFLERFTILVSFS
jgi:hypothetical protein